MAISCIGHGHVLHSHQPISLLDLLPTRLRSGPSDVSRVPWLGSIDLVPVLDTCRSSDQENVACQFTMPYTSIDLHGEVQLDIDEFPTSFVFDHVTVPEFLSIVSQSH